MVCGPEFARVKQVDAPVTVEIGTETYGTDRCWEVDILPATVIEQELDAHIHSWLDERLWRQRDREIERARALI